MPLPTPLIDPITKKLTPRAKSLLREILKAQYASRFFKFPPQVFPGPRPSPSVSDGDFTPQPNNVFENTLQQSLLGELLIHAMGDPMPEPNKVSFVRQIKEEKLDVEVVKELMNELEGGMSILQEELSALER